MLRQRTTMVDSQSPTDIVPNVPQIRMTQEAVPEPEPPAEAPAEEPQA